LCRCRGCGARSHDRRLVYGAWSSLRHHYPPRSDHWPCRRRSGLRRLCRRCLSLGRGCTWRGWCFLLFRRDLSRLCWRFDNWGGQHSANRCSFGLFVYRWSDRSRRCRCGGLGRHGFSGCRRLLCRLGLSRSRCLSRRGLYHHRRRNDCNGRAHNGCTCRCLRHNCSSRRFRRNRGSSRWNYRGSRPRLWHNLPRFGPHGNCCRSCDRHNRGCGLYGNLRRGRNSLAGGHVAPASLGFLFLLLGQNGLHYVPGLGDMRQVNLRGNALCCTR
jgi:hypothetical protein